MRGIVPHEFFSNHPWQNTADSWYRSSHPDLRSLIARWHPHVHTLVADGLFKMFTPLEFIAAITQRIPERLAQMVRYYGWKILSHLGLLLGEEQKRGPAPPKKCLEVVIEPFEEGWPEYGETFSLVQA